MPPTALDVFNTDAFSMRTLTGAINKVPYKPGRLGELGLFAEEPIATTAVFVEEKDGQLTLIQTSPRGAPGDLLGRDARRVIPFAAQHLSRSSKVGADEIQNVRAFGSDSQEEGLQLVIDGRLATLRAGHEVTWEYHRIGALKGIVYDADGTTALVNFFTAFNVAQQTKDFALDVTTTVIRTKCNEVQRQVEDALGAATYTGLRALCSATFFDSFIDHADVRDAWNWAQASNVTANLRRTGFEYGGITWEEYRGSVSGVDFVPANKAYVFPEGALTEDGPLFRLYFAPQPFTDTANRLNPPIVLKAVPDPAGRFVELLSVSCPLALCLRPRAVIEVSI